MAHLPTPDAMNGPGARLMARYQSQAVLQPATGTGQEVMQSVVPVCFPSSDQSFGERVRGFVHSERWHLRSSEGLALLQALLRESYPLASVIAHERVLAGDSHTVVVLDVYRDGDAGRLSPRRRP